MRQSVFRPAKTGVTPLPVDYDVIQNGQGDFANARVTSSTNVVAKANYSNMYWC